MGAYISSSTCSAFYGITPNCTVVLSPQDQAKALFLGGNAPGDFESDPDIAGIGVLGAFLAVTLLSLLLSIASTIWWFSKNIFRWTRKLEEEHKETKKWQLSVAGLLETLILTCSDQQIFTGGAYAITLRYVKGCDISAYHYNVVANMLLVTCATHLMAVTVSRHYWEHPWVGGLRVIVTTLVYLVTGILLSNQGSGSLGFPTRVPDLKEQYSPLLLPAACFQTGDSGFAKSFSQSFTSSSSFFGGRIPGWTQYLVMFIFYALAVFINLGRLIRRGTGHDGRRRRTVNWMKRSCAPLFRAKRPLYWLFGAYLVGGIGIASWTVVTSAQYVLELRNWVDKSGWMDLEHGRNPENDPSTFGQLVPVLLITLIIFTFLQILSEKLRERSRARHLRDLGGRSPEDNTLVQVYSRDQSPPEPRYLDKSIIGVAISEPEDLDHIATIDAGGTAAHARSQSRGSQSRGRSTTPLSRPLTKPPIYSMFPTNTSSPLGSPQTGGSETPPPPPVPKKSRSRDFKRGELSTPTTPSEDEQREVRPSQSRGNLRRNIASPVDDITPLQQSEARPGSSHSRADTRRNLTPIVTAAADDQQQHELRPSRSRDFRKNLATPAIDQYYQQPEPMPPRPRDVRRNGMASPTEQLGLNLDRI